MDRIFPFAAVAGGVKVRVRLTPKASNNRIDGLVPDADGGMALKAGVTAPPEGGKANAALVKMLAKAWRLPRTAISVAAGAGSRRKTLVIEGDTKMLLERLGDWMESHHG